MARTIAPQLGETDQLAQIGKRAIRQLEETNMSSLTSSNLRPSVSARAVVTVTALIAWSFSAYIGYLHTSSSPSVQTEQSKFSTTTSERAARNG
jgi:hypothetical protein